jgi:hypothetical protein
VPRFDENARVEIQELFSSFHFCNDGCQLISRRSAPPRSAG